MRRFLLRYWLRILLPRMKPKIPVRRIPIVVCIRLSISTIGETPLSTSESIPAIFFRLTPKAYT